MVFVNNAAERFRLEITVSSSALPFYHNEAVIFQADLDRRKVGRYKRAMNDSPTKTDFPVRQVRVKRPERQQIEWRDASLDQLIPRDHRVRAVWAYVDSLDLQPLYQKIQAAEGGVGRDAVDPKILMALWLFATVEAVGSARHLDRLSTRDLPYM